MKTIKSIQKISIIFFGITGIMHITAHLMTINGFFLEFAKGMSNILQIPFIISAAIYAFVSAKLSLSTNNQDNKIANIIFAILITVLTAGLIYLQLFVPDRI